MGEAVCRMEVPPSVDRQTGGGFVCLRLVSLIFNSLYMNDIKK